MPHNEGLVVRQHGKSDIVGAPVPLMYHPPPPSKPQATLGNIPAAIGADMARAVVSEAKGLLRARKTPVENAASSPTAPNLKCKSKCGKAKPKAPKKQAKVHAPKGGTCGPAAQSTDECQPAQAHDVYGTTLCEHSRLARDIARERNGERISIEELKEIYRIKMRIEEGQKVDFRRFNEVLKTL